MHSMLKSYKNTSNVDFYDNLHRKYFNKAKDGAKEKGSKPKLETKKELIVETESQIDDTGLFDLTDQSNTLMMGTSKSTILNQTNHREEKTL